MSAFWKFLKSDEGSNFATVLSAFLALLTTCLALLALWATEKVNRAEHRDKTFEAVIKAAKDTVGDSTLAPQLFLALHSAARNIDDGLLTAQDRKLLEAYLRSESSLKGRPGVCDEWQGLPEAIRQDATLRELADVVIQLDQCKSKQGSPP